MLYLNQRSTWTSIIILQSGSGQKEQVTALNIQNPHDKFFKDTFSDVEVARDFIQHYLPESVSEIIDLETLEAQRDSFISQELQETFTDMLYRVKINEKTGYLYFLFEH